MVGMVSRTLRSRGFALRLMYTVLVPVSPVERGIGLASPLVRGNAFVT